MNKAPRKHGAFSNKDASMKKVLLSFLLIVLLCSGFYAAQAQAISITQTPEMLISPTPEPWRTRVWMRTEKNKDGQMVEHCLIKGNINKKGDRIYHVPGWKDYDKTDIDVEMGEQWFCTEQDALDAGWRAPKYANRPK